MEFETNGRTDRRLSVRPFVTSRSDVDSVDVTAAIAVDVVAVRVCPSIRPFVSNSI